MADNDDRYKSLEDILARALEQASVGKGAERHATNQAFEEQPIIRITEMVGIGFPAGQAIKKVQEATRAAAFFPERAVADLLGAINYIAAEIILIERGGVT